ncbi:hypothetical protein NCAS_0A02610 [Naumovozyma castellii]|uniref:Vacuolar sorting protein 39/Transforming growth factor beta receptor-associated domain-containing protein n=1 Tax=Naumovozyma castellii TaxID=27288 RepID=G0V5T1_NAUCA|nr:hypothetical protein NCAS_0A02610 [Naumovozyma castellii CBS 4309]CCC66819.1 hypothetical protein NCAS_0A02610 [Naumovozyma castellii CBS 4309]
MLKARHVDSFKSDGISALLPIAQAQKLVIAKKDGSVEVYSNENSRFKLFQVYPNLLKTSQPNDYNIQELYYSDDLSTIFAQCKNTLVLLNSTNLHHYDQIYDKRGIRRCWIFESNTTHSGSQTLLLYTIGDDSKIRLLIWEDRHYKKMIEVSLPKSREKITSVELYQSKIILTTTQGIYQWSYLTNPMIIRIDKIVKRKNPKDLISALDELKAKTIKYENVLDQLTYSNRSNDNDGNTSIYSTGVISKKSSMSSFWKRRVSTRDESLDSVRYLFSTTNVNDSLMLIDGKTKNLFQVKLNEGSKPSHLVLATDQHFFNWNMQFSNLRYFSNNIILAYNSQTLRFIDFNYGFTFLETDIKEGIVCVERVSSTHFIVWTRDDQIQIYHFQVDDANDTIGISQDSSSICDTENNDFHDLWRKVLFYEFFLDSPDAIGLCSSDNPEESLDICAMKLRDLKVMWCLAVFDRFQKYMTILFHFEKGFPDPRDEFLQNYIIKVIFDIFTEFWAPPQLVILKTFPIKIAKLVNDITGQKHTCFLEKNPSTEYSIPADMVRKWCLPYLIDIRRHIKNLQIKSENSETLLWKSHGRTIKQNLEAFLVDDHGSIDIDGMLTLLDTVLFNVYLFYSPLMVGPFIRVANSCDYNTVFKELKSRRLYQELLDFSYMRGEHENSLKFLSTLINDTSVSASVPDIKENVKLLMVVYLKKLSNKDLKIIFSYTDWLINQYPDSKEGILLSIFCNDSENCVKRNHVKIYEYIKSQDEAISIQYLEFVIGVFGCDDTDLYAILINEYLDNLKISSMKSKLKAILETTFSYEPSTILSLLDDHISSIENNVEKMDAHMRNQLNFIKFLKTYPLERLQQHEDSIEILYGDLSDYKLASEYCSRVFARDPAIGANVLMVLLGKLVKQSGTEKGKFHLIQFLQENSTRIGLIEVFKILPNSFCLKDLGPSLLQTIRDLSIKKDEVRITKSLLQVEVVDNNYKMWQKLSDYMTLDENYTCSICKKTFSAYMTDEILWFNNGGRSMYVHSNCGKALESRIKMKRSSSGPRN